MSREEYLDGLIKELNEKGNVFRLEDRVSDSTVKYIEGYFTKKGNEFRNKKCARCKGTWEIMIFGKPHA